MQSAGSLAAQPTAASTPAPTPTSTPAPVCAETRGRFEFQEIQTTLMTHPLSFRVYLPPCYDFDAEARYPVLYLLHGQSFKDDQWDRWDGEALDELSHVSAPFIIVMPKESNNIRPMDLSRPGVAED